MSKELPRLRVERLAIVESRLPLTFIRDVRLNGGLNIVWAQETEVEGTTEVQRAGHGVGKSTFSLMLRAVLGDDGAAVKTMRHRLAEHFGSGGVAAEVIADGERFGVFRAYGAQSFARRGATIEDLFGDNVMGVDTLDFASYVTAIGEAACLRHMPTRLLPVTGQPVDWGHVLCWIARDQALGLRQYFEWRNDDGTGLRRRAADPPNLVRMALRILTEVEVAADANIARINRELSKGREAVRTEEQRGSNTRRIVETQLRTWANVSNSLQMFADDLFADSVEKELQRKTAQLDARNNEERAAVTVLELELNELAADIRSQDRTVQLAKARWDEAVALRSKDNKSLEEIRARRDKLLNLAGTCQYGVVSYGECTYVQAQRDTVQIAAKRDITVLAGQLDEQTQRGEDAKAAHNLEAMALAELVTAREQKTNKRRTLNNSIESRLRQLGESDSVRRTLTQWQESHAAPETERVRGARLTVSQLEKDLATAEANKLSAQEQVTDRVQQISARVAELTKVFGVTGRYEPFDEKRPFHMLGADGDAYTVLEILLGDLACATDACGEGGGAHPGLLIFDCPREREMSPHLYDRFLRLIDDECRATPALQIIVTTTTPPPAPLCLPPTRILKLSHASDDELLLKRRIENLLSRVAPAVREEAAV